ncbi:hypothetical protein ON010_g6910 [Phytophthora cinnamomi]|nr:hypothetical protein ON010_g6910 [Phytophthora cinnamomi]
MVARHNSIGLQKAATRPVPRAWEAATATAKAAARPGPRPRKASEAAARPVPPAREAPTDQDFVAAGIGVGAAERSAVRWDRQVPPAALDHPTGLVVGADESLFMNREDKRAFKTTNLDVRTEATISYPSRPSGAHTRLGQAKQRSPTQEVAVAQKTSS